MSASTPALRKLTARVSRLHPDDAAAVLADLSAAERARFLAQVDGPLNAGGLSPSSDLALSPWLASLCRSGAGLTPRASTALADRISGLVSDHGRPAAQAPSLGTIFVAWLRKAWRS